MKALERPSCRRLLRHDSPFESIISESRQVGRNPQLAKTRGHEASTHLRLGTRRATRIFTFSTLKKIAAAFGVAIIIDFVSFPEFLKWSESLTAETAGPDSFDESDKKGIDAFVPQEVSEVLSAKIQGLVEDALAEARQGALQQHAKGQPLSSAPFGGKNGTLQDAFPRVGS